MVMIKSSNDIKGKEACEYRVGGPASYLASLLSDDFLSLENHWKTTEMHI